jgi:hypothetical protein
VLYQGDHWTASQRALDAANEAGFAAELWVISAGYGLYPVNAAVTSYEATFSPGHPESVAPRGADGPHRDEYLQAWWAAVATLVRVPEAPARTFADLARADPTTRFLIIAGEHYLDAIAADLRAAQSLVANREQIAVVSAGASRRATDTLNGSVLPVDARFEHEVEGARTGLNARVAEWLLKGVADPRRFGAPQLRAKLEARLAELPPAKKYERKQLDDLEVQRWILKHRDKCVPCSATGMLRMLRKSGRACEQGRFKGLFHNVMRNSTGGSRG